MRRIKDKAKKVLNSALVIDVSSLNVLLFAAITINGNITVTNRNLKKSIAAGDKELKSCLASIGGKPKHIAAIKTITKGDFNFSI